MLFIPVMIAFSMPSGMLKLYKEFSSVLTFIIFAIFVFIYLVGPKHRVPKSSGEVLTFLTLAPDGSKTTRLTAGRLDHSQL
jgi:hypothetical protein